MAETLDILVEKIEDFLAEGDLEQAEATLDKGLEQYGDQHPLLALQVEISLEHGDYQEAFAVAESLLSKIDNEELRSKLYVQQGYAKYYVDDLGSARKLFNRAVHANPTSWPAIVGRAVIHEELGFLNATKLDLDRAIELDDQSPQPFSIRGSIFIRWGQLKEAEEDYIKAVELSPDDEESRLQLARLLALSQRSDEAIEILEPLLTDGDDAEFIMPAALLRSQLSLLVGSAEPAAEDAEMAIELAPDEPWGYLQLAACYLTAMDAGKALESLIEAEKRVDDISDLPDLIALRISAYEQLEKDAKVAELRNQLEGTARLPGVVYGEWLNPAQNIPINPNKPVDIRALLTDLFDDPKNAPEGYEKALRKIVDQIPQIIAQNPKAGQLQIELPHVEGMDGPPRSLVLQVNKPKQQTN